MSPYRQTVRSLGLGKIPWKLYEDRGLTCKTFKSGLSKTTRSVAGSFSGWPLGFSHQVKILWRTSHSSRFLCSDYILMTCWESCLISLYSNLYCSAIPQELGECRFHLETGEDSQSWTKEVPSSSGWQLSWRWWWWRLVTIEWWLVCQDVTLMLHFVTFLRHISFSASSSPINQIPTGHLPSHNQ